MLTQAARTVPPCGHLAFRIGHVEVGSAASNPRLRFRRTHREGGRSIPRHASGQHTGGMPWGYAGLVGPPMNTCMHAVHMRCAYVYMRATRTTTAAHQVHDPGGRLSVPRRCGSLRDILAHAEILVVGPVPHAARKRAVEHEVVGEGEDVPHHVHHGYIHDLFCAGAASPSAPARSASMRMWHLAPARDLTKGLARVLPLLKVPPCSRMKSMTGMKLACAGSSCPSRLRQCA